MFTWSIVLNMLPMSAEGWYDNLTRTSTAHHPCCLVAGLNKTRFDRFGAPERQHSGEDPLYKRREFFLDGESDIQYDWTFWSTR